MSDDHRRKGLDWTIQIPGAWVLGYCLLVTITYWLMGSTLIHVINSCVSPCGLDGSAPANVLGNPLEPSCRFKIAVKPGHIEDNGRRC